MNDGFLPISVKDSRCIFSTVAETYYRFRVPQSPFLLFPILGTLFFEREGIAGLPRRFKFQPRKGPHSDKKPIVNQPEPADQGDRKFRELPEVAYAINRGRGVSQCSNHPRASILRLITGIPPYFQYWKYYFLGEKEKRRKPPLISKQGYRHPVLYPQTSGL